MTLSRCFSYARAPLGAQCVFLFFLSFSALQAADLPVVVDSARAKARMPKVPQRKVKSDSLRSATTGPVVVTGTRGEVELKDSPVRVQLVDAEALKTSATTNLAQVLESQAGISLSSGLHSGVQLQGMSADYTQILIDGQPMIGRVAGVIDLNRIAVGNVRQVEIVKGPMSSLYGSDALAGVINLISQRPAPGWSGNFRLQELQHQGEEASVSIGYSNDDVDWTLFTNYKRSPEFSLTQDTLTLPYSGFRDLTVQSRIRTFVLPTLSLSANIREFRSQSVGAFVESYFGQISANQGSVDQNDFGLQLAADWIVGKAHVSAQLYASDFVEQYHFDVVQGSGSSLDDFHRTYYKPSLQYDLMLNDRNRLMFGTEYALDKLSGTRYASNPSYHTSVVYSQWEGNPTEWISYALSARYDINNEYGNSLSPKLSALFKLSDELGFRASVGSGFKAPDFRQLYVMFRNNLQGAGYVLMGARLLNNDLQAERSMSYECSLNYLLADKDLGSSHVRSFLELRAFLNKVSNMIEYYFDHEDGSVAVYSYHNLSHIRTQGLELSMHNTWVLAAQTQLSLQISYQYLDASDLDVLAAIDAGVAGSTDPKTGSFIPLTRANYGGLWFRSRNLFNVRSELRLPQSWSLSCGADYVGRFGDEALDKNGSVMANVARAVPDLPEEYVPGYWNVKLSCMKSIDISSGFLALKTVDVGAGVVNALNNLNLRSLPNMLGRQFYLNMRCSW